MAHKNCVFKWKTGLLVFPTCCTLTACNNIDIMKIRWHIERGENTSFSAYIACPTCGRALSRRDVPSPLFTCDIPGCNCSPHYISTTLAETIPEQSSPSSRFVCCGWIGQNILWIDRSTRLWLLMLMTFFQFVLPLQCIVLCAISNLNQVSHKRGTTTAALGLIGPGPGSKLLVRARHEKISVW